MLEDKYIARKYVRKITNAASAGHEFNLTFNEFKALFRRKTCAYSGIELADGHWPSNEMPFNARTIDRIDNSLGYVKGNVVAVCNGINSFKGHLEAPNAEIDIVTAHRALTAIVKLL